MLQSGSLIYGITQIRKAIIRNSNVFFSFVDGRLQLEVMMKMILVMVKWAPPPRLGSASTRISEKKIAVGDGGGEGQEAGAGKHSCQPFLFWAFKLLF